MASTYNQVAMTAVAASIIASNTNRRKLILKNTGTDPIYIGDTSSVVDTADNANGGYKLEANKTIFFNEYTGVLYGICAAAETSTLSIIEEEIVVIYYDTFEEFIESSDYISGATTATVNYTTNIINF